MSLIADVVSAKLLVTGDFWPPVLRIFQETECIDAVERHIIATTSDTLERAARAHPTMRHASFLERVIVFHLIEQAPS